jgi:hypothetical protein
MNINTCPFCDSKFRTTQDNNLYVCNNQFHHSSIEIQRGKIYRYKFEGMLDDIYILLVGEDWNERSRSIIQEIIYFENNDLIFRLNLFLYPKECSKQGLIDFINKCQTLNSFI